jgi:hypothetical protein
MLKTASLALGTLLVVCAGGLDAGETGTAPRWEYRVLSKEQILELGMKDLAAGLNRVGREGWELAAVDNAYIFKRRLEIGATSIEALKQRLALLEGEIAMRKERVVWSERMERKGFLSASQVEAGRASLQQAEISAGQARRELDALIVPAPGTDPKKTVPKN